MFAAILVAAGRGRRMGGSLPKQYMNLSGKPVLTRTFEAFSGMGNFFNKIVVVVPPGDMIYCREEILGSLAPGGVVYVEGGKERLDSVYNALAALKGLSIDLVCIHDGVRPFVSPSLIKDVTLEAQRSGAAIAAVPLTDTLKEADTRGAVKKTLSRERLWQAQTPQCFRWSIIWKAYEQARIDNYYATDDSALVERTGAQVKIVPGSSKNIKLTNPEDLAAAHIIMERGRTNI